MTAEAGSAMVAHFHQVGRRRRFEPGAVLLHSGDSSDVVHLIVSGAVRIVHWTRDGNEVLFQQVGAGSFVGEMGVLDGEPRSASVIAAGAVETMEVGAEDFRRWLKEHPEDALTLLRGLSRSVRTATTTRVAIRSSDVAARIASRLLQLTPPGTDGRLRLELRHDDLAAWASVNRETVTRALGRLREEALITTGRGWIEVLDRDGLLRRAAD